MGQLGVATSLSMMLPRRDQAAQFSHVLNRSSSRSLQCQTHAFTTCRGSWCRRRVKRSTTCWPGRSDQTSFTTCRTGSDVGNSPSTPHTSRKPKPKSSRSRTSTQASNFKPPKSNQKGRRSPPNGSKSSSIALRGLPLALPIAWRVC